MRQRRRDVGADIDEEFDSHLAMRIDALRGEGLSEEEARSEALRQFGDVAFTRRYCIDQSSRKERRMQRTRLLSGLLQDIRIGARTVSRAPLIALTIVLTVGIGIGATTAMFAAVDAALLRPLPYPHADELVQIYTDSPPYRFPFSVADYLALSAQQTTFSTVAGYADRAMTYSDRGGADRVPVRVASPTYFTLLGITPILGRGFVEADGTSGAPPAVVLSHDFWEQRLSGDPAIVGKTITLDGVAHTVAGVLPPDPGPLERGKSLFVAAQWTTPPRKGPFFIRALGRLANPDRRAVAAAELREIDRRMFPIWKSSYQDSHASWGMIDLRTYVARDFRTVAGVALAAVAFLWLIACVNAANLLLARVAARRRELAVRTALGASRARVVAHLLVEAGLLAAGAAALGVILAWGAVQLIQALAAPYVPRAAEITLGGRTAIVLALVTAASIAMFGLIPGLAGAGGPVDDALRSSGRGSTASARVRRLRNALVAVQFAVATPLLIVAVLLTGTLHRLQHVDVGLDPQSVLTGGVSLPSAVYRTPEQVTAFWNELQARVAALPGVATVAYTDSRPPDDAGNQNNFDLEDSPSPGSQPVTTWVAVTPEYFAAAGLRPLTGRLLEAPDYREDSAPVIVVDEAWAKRFFPGRSAVGRRLHEGGCTTCPWTTVVGVVPGVKYDGLATPEHGTVYSPMDPASRSRYLFVRVASGGTGVTLLRDTVRGLDPNVPLVSAGTIEDLVDSALEQPRGLSALAGGFGIVALVLSLIGVYGVMAYYVELHAKEISIRIALGGHRTRVARMVVGRGARLVALGVAVGVLLAGNVTRMGASLLYGVSPLDAPTFTAVAAGLIGLAVAACAIPAARAVSAEPSWVLRQE